MTDQLEALREAREAMNVWLHMHAGDMCDEAGVEAARAKIREAGGTLGFITSAIDSLTKAIGDDARKPKNVAMQSAALKIFMAHRHPAALSPTEADQP